MNKLRERFLEKFSDDLVRLEPTYGAEEIDYSPATQEVLSFIELEFSKLIGEIKGEIENGLSDSNGFMFTRHENGAICHPAKVHDVLTILTKIISDKK